MKNVLKMNHFISYKKTNLSESKKTIVHDSSKTTIFISHKHSDLETLRDFIGFLEKEYNVICYIDSDDPSLPRNTSGETAMRIKKRITECDKFILLATEGAIDSKWCNWELGYGDANKFNNHNIALVAFAEHTNYNGNEYLEIYPHIVYSKEGDTYSSGRPILPGYYIKYRVRNGGYNITTLREWLKRKYLA